MAGTVLAPEAAPTGSRAGRNLPVAIAIGLGMGALVLIPLYTSKVVFLGVVAAAVVEGMREMVIALRAGDIRAPLLPLALGTVLVLALAYTDGREPMTVALVLTAVAVILWRLAEGPDRMLPDIGGSLLALVYVGFLPGFAALMLAPHDGSRRITVFVATVVCSDVGGYAAGVLFGKHLMAPNVSPKKSWEGLAGSMVTCAIGAALMLTLLLHGAWWQGVLYGMATATTATIGDLGESVVKRDLGIKDMGNVLPGHGGLMDRLDSLLPTAPVAWLLLTAFVPS